MRIEWFAVALVALAPAVAGAEDAGTLDERLAELEERVENLEEDPEPPEPVLGLPTWTRNVRLGGSANAGYYGGRKGQLGTDSFLVWDARFFVDAHLSDAVTLGERTIFRNVGFSFEWNLIRLGMLQNDVGDLFADFQGFLGRNALNFQLGRFQIPVGEAYLRYGQGYAAKPFVSSPVGGPWWWDEGVRFYGSGGEGTYGYVSSITDGETPFNLDAGSGTQFTLKLFWRPLAWLYLSASGLRSGSIGSAASPAAGALWLGESWARAFGSGTEVPSYQDGIETPDGPNVLKQTRLLAGDVVLNFTDRLRIWLGYGNYAIDSSGPSLYDRALHYWVAEAILPGVALSPVLRPFYLGLRVSGLGTYDGGKGYLLDFRQASSIGYNARALTDYSAVLGWDLNSTLRLRAEYTNRDVQVVRGVSDAIRGAAGRTDLFAFEVGAAF
jgi:hypothetical protein